MKSSARDGFSILPGSNSILPQISTGAPAIDSAGKRVRPILITDSDQFAGTERHMIDLARALKATGIDVLIACPSQSIIASKAESFGIELITVSRANFVTSMSLKLANLLRTNRINVLHAHNGVSHVTAVCASALGRRGKCVVTQHFVNPARRFRRGWKAAVAKMIHCLVENRTSRFIAVSNAVAGVCKREKICPAEKLSLVLNGIYIPADPEPGNKSSRAEYSIEHSVPLIVCVSRLMPEKNIDVLIKSMASVRAHFSDAKCIIIGDGTCKASLGSMVNDLNLCGVVELVGYRDKPTSLIRACDVFVSPGAGEGFGLAVVEAMSLGVPVVAANSAGTAELIEQGETGLLFAPNDANSLADQIIRLLESNQLRSQLAKNAKRECMNNYTAELMAERTARIYEAVLSDGEKIDR